MSSSIPYLYNVMLDFKNPGLVLGLIILIALVTPAAAFGAGNIASISKIEGQNCTLTAANAAARG